MQITLSGVVVLALSGCGDDDPTYGIQVAIADLVNTGANGYKMTATIDGTDPVDFYFCTDAVDTYDYAMYDANVPYIPWADEPSDYGGLDYEGTLLGLFSVPEDDIIIVETGGPTPGYLQEGRTYNYEFDFFGDTGTVTVKKFSDFNCSDIMVPI